MRELAAGLQCKMQFSHWYFKANKALRPLWQLLFTDEEGLIILCKKTSAWLSREVASAGSWERDSLQAGHCLEELMCSDMTTQTCCKALQSFHPYSVASRRISASSAIPYAHTWGMVQPSLCTQSGRQHHSFHTCKHKSVSTLNDKIGPTRACNGLHMDCGQQTFPQTVPVAQRALPFKRVKL